jgi:Fic family protein
MHKWLRYRIEIKAVRLLAKIERFHGNWEKNKRLKPAAITSLTQTTIVTSSGASTRIEGAILSDKEVQQLLENGCKISKLSSRSEREVAGYIKALTYVYENAEHLEVCEKTIREIHQLLTSDLLEDQLPSKQRGTYKDVPNDVVEKNEITGKETVWFRTTPPGIQTTTQMMELIENFATAIENELHPIIRAALFIVHFLAIHPFRDGNGRVARILTSLILLKEYKWFRYTSHEKVIEDNKEAYYVSLRKTQETLDCENVDYDPWVIFFLQTVVKQTIVLEEQLINFEGDKLKVNLVGNEAKVYAFLLKQGESPSSAILRNMDISKDGLKKLLKRLVDKGLVQKIGVGTSTRYRI